MSTTTGTKRSLIYEAGFQRYFRGERWEDLNRQFFDGLAVKYDRLNEVLSFGQHRAIKRRAIRRLSLPADAKILDLCTGSGDIAVMMSRRFPQADITALDASHEMLKVARAKAADCKNVRFIQGDALATALPDASFDAVFIGFGLRNLLNIDEGIAEMIRVLRPGGWLSILDLGKPRGAFCQSLYSVYFEQVMPLLGKTIFHRGEFNSFAYLPASNRYFLSPDEVACRLRRQGLRQVQVFDYLLGGISQQIGQKPK